MLKLVFPLRHGSVSTVGLPQGTKLRPFLFAVSVNSLVKDWSARIKFVYDTTTLEFIPRCHRASESFAYFG